VASNDINEAALEKFNNVGHSIDTFGIGTNLVTCQKQPALGMVYKLVECKGRSTMKLSEEVEKTTLPSTKSVWRVWVNGAVVDIITTQKERIQVGVEVRGVNIRKPNERYSITPTRVEELLELVLQDGKCLKGSTLGEARAYCQQQMSSMKPSLTRTSKPEEHVVLLSEHFYLQFRAQLESLLIYKVL
jgi:nicotinate phosphoribosyltransferase